MWVLGVTLLLVLTSCLCVLAARRQGQPSAAIWDIGGTARTYTTIVGSLAAFSVTSSIFVANLTVARQSPAFESVMALFLVAFLIFISSGMQFGTTPNLPNPTTEIYAAIQTYSYLFANASFYLAISLSWLGLPLLLAAVGLTYLGDIFLWLILTAIVGGAIRVSSSGLNVLARVDFKISLCLPIICFIAAAFYRLVLGELLDSLLPTEHGPALFAVLCAVVATVGISLQSAMVGSLREESSAEFFGRLGRPLLLVYEAAVFTSSALLWLAVWAHL